MGKKKDPTEIHQSARFTMFIKRLQELLPSRAQIAHRLNGLVTVSAVDAWVARESLPRDKDNVFKALAKLVDSDIKTFCEYLDSDDPIEAFFPALALENIMAVAGSESRRYSRSHRKAMPKSVALGMPKSFYSADSNPDRDTVLELIQSLSPEDRFFVLAHAMHDLAGLNLAEPPNTDFSDWIKAFMDRSNLSREVLSEQVAVTLVSGEEDVLNDLPAWIDGEAMPTMQGLRVLARVLRDDRGLPIPFSDLAAIAYPKD